MNSVLFIGIWYSVCLIIISYCSAEFLSELCIWVLVWNEGQDP